jgi:hypothetical protein
MFFMRQRGTLARGAAWHEPIGTLVDLPLDQPLEGRLVYRDIGKETKAVIDPLNTDLLLI